MSEIKKQKSFANNFVNARRRRRIKKHKAKKGEKQLRDWIVPLRHNFWVQLGAAFLLLAFFCLGREFLYCHFTANNIAIVILLFFAGGGILGATEFGGGTVKSYRRTRYLLGSQIDEIKFDVRLQKKIARELYCYRVGARVAATEKGLSKKLIPALADKWKPF